MNAQERSTIFQQNPKVKSLYQWTVATLIAELVLIAATIILLQIITDITFTGSGLIQLFILLLPGIILFAITFITVFLFSPRGKFWLWLSFGLSAFQVIFSPYLQNLISAILVFIAAILYSKALSELRSTKNTVFSPKI